MQLQRCVLESTRAAGTRGAQSEFEDADGLAAFEFSRRAGGCGLDEIRRERDAGAQGECRIGGGNAGRAPKAIGRRVCGGLT